MGNKSKEEPPLFLIYRENKGYGYVDKAGKEVVVFDDPECYYYFEDEEETEELPNKQIYLVV